MSFSQFIKDEENKKRSVAAPQSNAPIPPSAPLQNNENFFSKAGQVGVDVGTGILKSVGETTRGIFDLATKPLVRGLSGVASLAKGQNVFGEEAQREAQRLEDTVSKDLSQNPILGDKALEAKNTAQSVGKIAGNIGQFFVAPQAAAGKAAASASRIEKIVKTATPIVKNALQDTALTTAQSRGDIETGLGSGGITAGLGVLGAAKKAVSPTVMDWIKQGTSRLSGVSVEAIERAARRPEAVKAATAAMAAAEEGASSEITAQAQKAYKAFKQKASDEYEKAFSKIPKTVTVEKNPLKETVDNFVASNPALSDKALSTAQKISQAIDSWKDVSAVGINNLRKKIVKDFEVGGLPESLSLADKETNRLVNEVAENISRIVGEKVPEIAKANKDYAAAKAILNRIDAGIPGLGTSGTSAAEIRRLQTGSRRLKNANNQASDVYKDSVDALDEISGGQIKDSLAGQEFTPLLPNRGLIAPLLSGAGAAGLGAAIVQNPENVKYAPLAAAFSPRLVGFTARNAPKAAQVAEGLAKVFGPGINTVRVTEAQNRNTAQNQKALSDEEYLQKLINMPNQEISDMLGDMTEDEYLQALINL
jgi:hypothetical protein